MTGIVNEESTINTSRICKDEMNLAEFPLSVIGKRVPKGVKTIEFQDEIRDPKSGDTIHRHLTITGSDLLGLPTSVDDEVLVGCLKLTKDYKLERRRVPFTAYQFLEELGWSRDTKSYRRLTQSLDRWAGTRVYSNNAFWHKGKQKLVKDSFGLIDRWTLTEDAKKDSDKSGWFLWGDFVWESLQAGNIRTLDFEFWKSLESPVAKRLFRFLDKRFYKRGSIAFPLKTLAFDKVGISRKLHTGQIKESLKKGHQELEKKGFCKSDFVDLGRGTWEVVYTDTRIQKKLTSKADKPKDPLELALVERGIKNAAELLGIQSSRKRIASAIENYDNRIASGEKMTHRWLAACIIHKTGYDFRHDYKTVAQRETEKKASIVQEQNEQEKKRKKAQAKKRENQRLKNEFQSYLDSLGSEKSQAQFLSDALVAFPIYESLRKDSVKRGALEKAEQHRRNAGLLHWKNCRQNHLAV